MWFVFLTSANLLLQLHSESNWEDHLRAQYLARHPDETLLGTIEEPFPWSGLPLWQKVSSQRSSAGRDKCTSAYTSTQHLDRNASPSLRMAAMGCRKIPQIGKE